MGISNGRSRAMLAVAAVAGALMLVGSASAAAAPATWMTPVYGATQISLATNPLTFQVGTNPPVVCGFGSLTGNATNWGVPLQGHFQGGGSGSSCPGSTGWVVGGVQHATKSGTAFTLSFATTAFAVKDAVAQHTVPNTVFAGSWSNATKTLTFAPGTPAGTTTTGLPVTVSGALYMTSPGPPLQLQ